VQPDGTTVHGANEPDQSIVGFIQHALRDSHIVDYLEQNRLTPTMVARAFNACGLDGVRSVLDGVKRSPELAAWYSTQPELVVMPFVIPQPAAPADLMADGQALLQSLRAYVERVQALIG
jgi:hypothetical protein